MYKILPILLFAYGLAVTTSDIYDNSWALIIGIDKYEKVQNLNYAVKDAESMQDILVNTFNFPKGNITLLKNEEANKDAILKAFSDLTKTADDNDRVLIYFAGHGETMDLTEGGEMGYLLPVDGNSEDLYLSSIAMDELEKISLMSKAKHTLYLIDACYGGILAVGSRGLNASSTPNYIEKITRNRAVQIITAGGRGEQVIEKPKWGHSAFTLNLNRGLKEGNADMNGDGYITANELGMFLSEKVTIDSDNQQTPQYGRMTSQEGEFVFISKVKNLVIIDNEMVNVSETNIDYDVLASKLAEKLREDDDAKKAKIEQTKQNKKRLKSPVLSILSMLYNKRNLSLGVDLTHVFEPGIHSNVTSTIPKLVYKRNRYKISLGYGYGNMYGINFINFGNEYGDGSEPDDVPIKLQLNSAVLFSINYLIYEYHYNNNILPVLLIFDWNNVTLANTSNDNNGDAPDYYYTHGQNANLYNLGLGTQLKNGIKFEIGIFDFRRLYQSSEIKLKRFYGGGLEKFEIEYPFLYFKIGYDRLPF